MTLALLLTAVGGAWAQTETLLTTITGTGPNANQATSANVSYSTANVANVSFSTTAQGQLSYLANWGWWGYGWIATVTAAEGYTITKCVFYDDANRTATDSEAPFVAETTEEDKTPRINGTPIDGGNNLSKGLKKIEVYGYETPTAPTEPDVVVTTNAASEQDLFTEASFKMPAFDATVNYELVRDMQDEANPVAFSGLPANDEPIVVKKGSDGKYQPAEALTIQLIDPLAAAEAQNIIAADGITVKVLVGAENGQGAIDYDQDNPITLEAFLADMTPGYYWIKAEPTDENSPYDGTVYSSEFTVVEQYDLTVKPANDFSKGKIDKVVVGTDEITPDATTGEATKTGIDPGTEVKLKAKKGYIIEKVEAKKPVILMLNAATTENIGMVVCNKGHLHDAKTAVPDGCTAVGILSKVTGTGHGLILALSDATSQTWNTINGWASASYAGTTLKVLPDADARGTNLTSYTTLGETTVSDWAVAQKSDYEAIFTNLGSTTGDSDGTTYDGNVNAYITTGVGGTAITDVYWSATFRQGNICWSFDYISWGNYNKTDGLRVRPVLCF